MHRVSEGIARGVLAVAVVVSLAVPAKAVSREQAKRPSLVQLVKQWMVQAFGDGLTTPRP